MSDMPSPAVTSPFSSGTGRVADGSITEYGQPLMSLPVPLPDTASPAGETAPMDREAVRELLLDVAHALREHATSACNCDAHTFP